MVEKIKKKLVNIKNGYKSEGFKYVIHAIMQRIPRNVFYYKHYKLFTTTKPKFITRQYSEYKLKVADLSDVDAIAKLGIYSEEKVLSRLKRGHNCRIVLLDGKVVSILWAIIIDRVFSVDGPIIDIGKEAFFVDGLYTIPEERLKGFHIICFKSLYDYFSKLGRNRILGMIHVDNQPSIRTHKRMGFEDVGETYYMILLGISFCYYKKWPHETKRLHIFKKRPPKNLEWV